MTNEEIIRKVVGKNFVSWQKLSQKEKYEISMPTLEIGTLWCLWDPNDINSKVLR